MDKLWMDELFTLVTDIDIHPGGLDRRPAKRIRSDRSEKGCKAKFAQDSRALARSRLSGFRFVGDVLCCDVLGEVRRGDVLGLRLILLGVRVRV